MQYLASGLDPIRVSVGEMNPRVRIGKEVDFPGVGIDRKAAEPPLSPDRGFPHALPRSARGRSG